MSLRVRLIVVFFLLSVVPLAAVTFYTYVTSTQALRDAAGREAELLAGELTERMKLVTAQLSQQFVRLMNIPTAPAAVATPSAPSSIADSAAPPPAAAAATNAENTGDEAQRVASQLGEIAMLLNNIEVRGFDRGRSGLGPRGINGGPPVRPGGGPPDPQAPEVGGRFGTVIPPGYGDVGGRGRRGRDGGIPPGGAPPDGPPGDDAGRFGGGRRGGGPPPTPDPTRIQIDLGPVRRDLMQQMFPDRERFEQLSPEEREQVLAKVNERMLGIQQGIQLLQQKASERAAVAETAMATPADDVAAAAEPSSRPPVPSVPPAAPARAPAPAPSAAVPEGALQRQTAITGTMMDVRVTQNGTVVGQVNAELNLPNLLAAVFASTRREQGEVPFAVDPSGRVYTPTDADGRVITALETTASRADTPPGTTVLADWVVVTTPDPTGSELKFGIARPLGDALDELRRSSARNAVLGLGLIGVALIGIVPLSSRLTRNLSRLSDGVNRIAKGDYRARVDVSTRDEIGRLATAFNQMAADVERHERAAVQQERLRRELELGRQIQHDMLPQSPLRLGLTEIRGVSVPATEVGGDFYDYFQTPSGTIALVVGDVSGKGVGAALLMANIQASLRTRFALGQDLASLARELDADIGASTPDAVYATLFVGLLDAEHRTLHYVNAGHNPQCLLRVTGGLERMEATGMPIGLLAGHGYDERRVELSAGDLLFFYTDGCVEAESPTGEMFGTARLESLLPAGQRERGAETLARVEGAITQFRAGREPSDDATMMVVNVG